MAILLPEGAGYIGTHTAVELLNTGKDFKFYEPIHMVQRNQ